MTREEAWKAVSALERYEVVDDDLSGPGWETCKDGDFVRFDDVCEMLKGLIDPAPKP